MKSQSLARAEAGEIRNEGINTGTLWGSSAAARGRGDCPRLAMPVPVVCGKITHDCPSPSWDGASQQDEQDTPCPVLEQVTLLGTGEGSVTRTKCSGCSSQTSECDHLHGNPWKGWESHPASSCSTDHSSQRKDEASRCDSSGLSKPHSPTQV